MDPRPSFVERRGGRRPLFSICIPQYNRTSFLLAVIDSIRSQRFPEIEVCISDDCSTDGREQERIDALQASGLPFAYRRQARNTGYDGNLRSAIDLAAGQFCFLLGNDDALKDGAVLEALHEHLAASPDAAVILTNFEESRTGEVVKRARHTGVAGAGPAVAAAVFRRFSFVSGVALRTDLAQAAATPQWDGSEMYQMYIGCRLIADGGPLLDVDLVTVCKDIQLAAESVDSYATRPRLVERGMPLRFIPLAKVPALVISAMCGTTPRRVPRRLVLNVLAQHFAFLCPYWLLEYRRVQSWRYAAGIARGLRPARSLATAQLSALERLCAGLLFAAGAAFGLAAPPGALRTLQRPAASVARWIGGRAAIPSSPV